MKLTINAKNLMRTLAMTTAAILICASPAMAQGWWFKGKLKDGRKVIGAFDSNHEDICLKLGEKFLKGHIENMWNNPYSVNENKRKYENSMIFKAKTIYKKINGKAEVNIYQGILNIVDSGISSKPLKNNFLTERELSSLDTCSIFDSGEAPQSVSFKAEFITNHQKYWFFVTEHFAGSERLNISKPNFEDARYLKVLGYEYDYIEDVKKVPGKNASFYFNIREGNGSRVPIVTYMLNLTNPSKPVLKKIRTFLSD